ncbi:f-box domain-containing protein [Fusarium mundagurra]|uniref:F-box domain-containing protein n=1 Tax=Fusarium mundagurra TaxID=1567541 RepID=A0A8H5Z6R6_9HYPO|nr:f-box domain-containing protein [Fusarium mundagurra]
MTNWNSLPAEIRRAILEALTAHKAIAPYASVSTEWRSFIEKKTFAHIRLHPSCLEHLEQLDDHYQRLVKHIWLNIELKKYTCRSCRKRESLTLSYSIANIVKASITRLFSILATWKESLTLEFNVYCPSDSEHWFKNSYFGAPDEDKFECYPHSTDPIHDPKHGWFDGRVTEAPPDDALRRPFGLSELKFQEGPEGLPSVHAVTKFVLRRQCRQQFSPGVLSYLWVRLPNLKEISYEPWQSHLTVAQDHSDEGTLKSLPVTVNKITIFEDFNENFLDLYALRRGILSDMNPPRVRLPKPSLGAAFAAKSQKLHCISVAFMIDARHFFKACQLDWHWPHLQSLTLTARGIFKANACQTNRLLKAAAQFALNTPQLQVLTLWHGERREACAFTYCRKDALVSWRGTRDLKLESGTIEAWEDVANKHTGRVLSVEKRLSTDAILSHGHAICLLGLNTVVDQISLQQICEENKTWWS